MFNCSYFNIFATKNKFLKQIHLTSFFIYNRNLFSSKNKNIPELLIIIIIGIYFEF